MVDSPVRVRFGVIAVALHSFQVGEGFAARPSAELLYEELFSPFDVR